MKPYSLAFFSLALIASLITGCGGGTKEPAANTGTPATTPSTEKPATPAALPELPGEVTLDLANWETVKEKIASHKGKVVVVDVWSNWCEPCMKEFPNLVNLQREHQAGVVCISLNTNFNGLTKDVSDEDKATALEFLKEQGAKFPNFICTDTDETLYGQIPITSVPTVLVYDQDGKLAKQFDEDLKTEKRTGFNYKQDIVPFVKQLLKSKS